MLFHIAGVLVEHYEKFLKYLETGTSQGSLQGSIENDLSSTTAHAEFQVLGLIGKLLTGPWIKKF